MRHREVTQDNQATILSTKASFLFTAGTTVIGASAAFAGLLIDRTAISGWPELWPSLIAVAAYIWLATSFFFAYRVKSFQRVPEPKQLMTYTSQPVDDAKRKVSDGRRFALLTNDSILNSQAMWVNFELIALLIVIGGVTATLVNVVLV